MGIESIKARDPDLYKAMQEDRDLERQTRGLADQFRRADKDEQAKIKTKLAEVVDKHFAVRQQLRTLEVKRLEQQVKELRERIEQREKSRKDIVSKRITELTGTDEGEHF
jgi:predicted  nucleic acid-binding Zn-ribbon protein